jgi:hypothetical protein
MDEFEELRKLHKAGIKYSWECNLEWRDRFGDKIDRIKRDLIGMKEADKILSDMGIGSDAKTCIKAGILKGGFFRGRFYTKKEWIEQSIMNKEKA